VRQSMLQGRRRTVTVEKTSVLWGSWSLVLRAGSLGRGKEKGCDIGLRPSCQLL
jgi:hypothetical protein